jgi:hypothetical protein
MADVPTNQRLWDSLVVQAKSKFKTWPSIPASKWVRENYVNRGGHFVDSKSVTASKKRSEASAKKRREAAKKGEEK